MALDLNGTTQYVSFPTAIVPLDTGTLSWWCAPDFASTSTGVESFFHDVQGPRYGIYKATSASKIFVYFDAREQAFDVAWTTGVLTHFLFRYRKSDNTLDLWIGGVQCTTGAGSGTWGSTALGTNIRLGSDHTGGARLFDGDVAEYATWNVLLDTAEIAALSKGISPLLVRPTSMLGYVPLISDGRPTKGANAGTLTGSPAISTHPRIFRPNAPRIPKIFQVIAGTLSATIDPITLASTGILAIAGSASSTIAAITLAATGTLPINGVLSAPIGDILAAGAAGLEIAGVLSVGIGEITLASDGISAIAGTLSASIGQVTLSAAATLSISGQLSTSIGDILASGAAGIAIAGVLSAPIGDITLSASGAAGIAGTLSSSIGDITLSATATIDIAGNLGATLGPVTLAATGALAISGTLSAPIGDILAAGAAGLEVSGTLAQSIGPITLTTSGVLPLLGVLSSSIGDITLIASGALPISGGLAQSIGDITLIATGTVAGGAPPLPEPDAGGFAGGMPRQMTLAEIEAFFGVKRPRLDPASLAILMVILADD